MILDTLFLGGVYNKKLQTVLVVWSFTLIQSKP